MLTHFEFIREAPERVGDAAPAACEPLAALLVEEPVEVELTAHGARRRGRRFAACREAAVVLLRRNIGSLLARVPDVALVARTLASCLRLPAREAIAALEDAGLVQNLSASLFLEPGAEARISGGVLTIDLGVLSEDLVSIRAADLRAAGAQYFRQEPLGRILRLGVAEVRLDPAAVLPPALQAAPGAVMLPGTAEKLRKGAWRGDSVPHFLKDHCVNCARCFVHCPDGAILHSEVLKGHGEETGVLGIDQERCTGCGTCEVVCPPGKSGYRAIVMVAEGATAGEEDHRVA